MGMKLRNRIIASLLIIGAGLHGMAHAEDLPRDGGGGATSWSWTGSFGVHFHSEDLFADIPPSSPLLPGGGTGKELPDQADTAGLQGLGIVGDWHPFQNGFRLSFAMYLDSNESGGFGTQKHPVPGIVADGRVPLSGDFELIPYLGVGWRTNGEELEGLELNLDIGAFLPGESSLHGRACRDPVSAPPSCDISSASLGSDSNGLFGSFHNFEWYPVVSLGIEYRF